MTALVMALVFLLILGIGIIIYIPVYWQHFYCYEVRVRPRKEPERLRVSEPKDSALLSAFILVGQWVRRFAPAAVGQRTRQIMAQANYRSSLHLDAYVGIKALSTASVAVMLLPLSIGNPLQLVLLITVSVFTWMLPGFFLAGRAGQRRQKVIRELPTVVDLLIVCAQAGLGLFMAIDKVSKEVADSCPSLHAEFQQLLQDVKLFAKPTHVALADMAERCGVEELNNLTATLISCEMKGSDISYPLKQQSLAIRERIKRKREEEASTVPVKMVPVIMFFIMPLILCPMLGPAVIIIIQSLAIAFGQPPPR
jgi:tight adherence protein C